MSKAWGEVEDQIDEENRGDTALVAMLFGLCVGIMGGMVIMYAITRLWE